MRTAPYDDLDEVIPEEEGGTRDSGECWKPAMSERTVAGDNKEEPRSEADKHFRLDEKVVGRGREVPVHPDSRLPIAEDNDVRDEEEAEDECDDRNETFEDCAEGVVLHRTGCFEHGCSTDTYAAQ